MDLRGPARFAKLHSEVGNLVRSFVDSTCSAGIRTNKKKDVALKGDKELVRQPSVRFKW